MSDQRTIEEAVLDKFFERLAVRENFPREIIDRLHQLRQQGRLKDVEQILSAFKEGGS